jgi:DNA-binding NarL/FixJ family response regulator
MPKNILIVDDNDLLRTSLNVLLTGHFEDVSFVEAANGKDAIEKARANPPDLIILDLAMPVMNGLSAAPILKGLAPRAPILLFTLYANELRDPYQFGVDVVVPKAKGADTFLNAVRELLASHGTPIAPTAPVDRGTATLDESPEDSDRPSPHRTTNESSQF